MTYQALQTILGAVIACAGAALWAGTVPGSTDAAAEAGAALLGVGLLIACAPEGGMVSQADAEPVTAVYAEPAPQ